MKVIFSVAVGLIMSGLTLIAYSAENKQLKPLFQVNVAGQRVNVMPAIQKNIKHTFTVQQLKEHSNRKNWEVDKLAPSISKVLKDLLGSRYGEFEHALNSGMSNHWYSEKGKALYIDSGRSGIDRYNVVVEFKPDGTVSGAYKDRGTSGTKGVAICTDFGMVNPGYWCEQDFKFD